MKFTEKELIALEWLAQYGKKIAEDNMNSILVINPPDWNTNLENACNKLLEKIEEEAGEMEEKQ